MSPSHPPFLRSENGSITVEAVIALPLVLLAFLATFVFFDVFRVSVASQKAAYTVADALSRQTAPVAGGHIQGLHELHDILARTPNPTSMRVSSIGWSDEGEAYVVIWSVRTGAGATLTDADLNGPIGTTLPPIPEGETLIFVETHVTYTPLFDVGIAPGEFRQAVVTRPRFAPQLPFDDGTTILVQIFGPPTCDDGEELCG